MKTSRVILLCIFIGGVGFFAGRLGSGPDGSGGAGSGDAGAAAGRRDGSQSERAQGAARGQGDGSGVHGRAGIPAAAKAVLGQGLDSIRLERWIQFLAKNLPDNAAAIAELLAAEKLEGRTYPTATSLFWQTWAKDDPKGALAYIREHEGEGGGTGIGDLMKGWAFYDPAGAVEAFANLGDSPLSGPALGGLASGLAGSDPAAAVDFATRLPDKLQTGAAVQIASYVVRESKIEEAQTWFDALPGGKVAALPEGGGACVAGGDDPPLRSRCGGGICHGTSGPSLVIPAGGAEFRGLDDPAQWRLSLGLCEQGDGEVSAAGGAAGVHCLGGESEPEIRDRLGRCESGASAAERVLAGTARVFLKRGQQEEAAALLERVQEPGLREMAEKE